MTKIALYVLTKARQPSTRAGIAAVAQSIGNAGGLTKAAIPVVLAGLGAILAN